MFTNTPRGPNGQWESWDGRVQSGQAQGAAIGAAIALCIVYGFSKLCQWWSK